MHGNKTDHSESKSVTTKQDPSPRWHHPIIHFWCLHSHQGRLRVNQESIWYLPVELPSGVPSPFPSWTHSTRRQCILQIPTTTQADCVASFSPPPGLVLISRPNTFMNEIISDIEHHVRPFLGQIRIKPNMGSVSDVSLATPPAERPSSLPQAFPHLMEALFVEVGSIASLIEAQAQGSLSASDLEGILHLITLSSEFRVRLEQPPGQAPSRDAQVLSPPQPPPFSTSLPGAFPPTTPSPRAPPHYYQHCHNLACPRESHPQSLHDRTPTSVSTACHGHPPLAPFVYPECSHRPRHDVGTSPPKLDTRAAVRKKRRLDSGPPKPRKGLLRLLPRVAKA